MVKIKKGNLTAIVPYSTYKNHYEKLGWKKKNGKRNKPTQDDNTVNTESETYDNYDVDLMSMNISQLKNFAAQKGIDISEASSKKEVREIIEEALNS